MPLPNAREAQPFYRAAKQRFEDAEFLVEAERTTAAVYLAGYGVECMLKALILESVPRARRASVIQTFRGGKAHNYEWLRQCYLEFRGSQFPPVVARAFALVSAWSTDLRYATVNLKINEANAFIRSVEQILNWADERF